MEGKLETLKNFNKISSTALLCAEVKAKYTDLPYAEEIYKLISENQKKQNEIIDPSFLKYATNDSLFKTNLSLLEGRHLAINDAIDNLSGCPILELSAGLSSRGLEFSNRFYIETDLPEIILIKKKILNK